MKSSKHLQIFTFIVFQFTVSALQMANSITEQVKNLNILRFWQITPHLLIYLWQYCILSHKFFRIKLDTQVFIVNYWTLDCKFEFLTPLSLFFNVFLWLNSWLSFAISKWWREIVTLTDQKDGEHMRISNARNTHSFLWW